MKLTELEKQEIKKIGKKYNLKLIILHGSYATGKARINSDLDIAIIGKKLIDFRKLAKIYSALSKVLGDNIERELDIKTLNRADPLFCYHIAKYSELLYGSLLNYNEFRAYAFRSYYDSKDLFKLEGLLVSKFQNYLNKKYA
jgi:predicted nucleotidyltransferase